MTVFVPSVLKVLYVKGPKQKRKKIAQPQLLYLDFFADGSDESEIDYYSRYDASLYYVPTIF